MSDQMASAAIDIRETSKVCDRDHDTGVVSLEQVSLAMTMLSTTETRGSTHFDGRLFTACRNQAVHV